MEAKAQIAKTELFKMKSLFKALATLSASLEETIELLTVQSLELVRSVGLASLPDDVLASILELSCSTENGTLRFDHGDARKLASVCRRFRDIALHLPSLWQRVCSHQSAEWVLKASERCPNPIVCVDCPWDWRDENELESAMLASFLTPLFPSSSWTGLHFNGDLRKVDKFFGEISRVSGGNLGSVKTLSIAFGDFGFYRLEDEATAATNISKSGAALLSTWRLQSLEHLVLKRLIPTSVMSPNLRTCSITLSPINSRQPLPWDLDALKSLLSSISTVESLSLSFIAAFPPDQYQPADSDPVKLPRLADLALTVGRSTTRKCLSVVMDMMDLAAMSSWEVSLIDWYDDLDSLRLQSWFSAIFTTQIPPKHTRTFSNVKSFSLCVDGERKILPLPYTILFPNIPNVQRVRLDLPFNYDYDYSDFKRIWEGITDICIVKLPAADNLLQIAKDLGDQSEAKSLKRFEIGGYGEHSRGIEEIRKVLGDKLIQLPN